MIASADRTVGWLRKAGIKKNKFIRTCFISRLFSCHALLPLLFNTWQHIYIDKSQVGIFFVLICEVTLNVDRQNIAVASHRITESLYLQN